MLLHTFFVDQESSSSVIGRLPLLWVLLVRGVSPHLSSACCTENEAAAAAVICQQLPSVQFLPLPQFPSAFNDPTVRGKVGASRLNTGWTSSALGDWSPSEQRWRRRVQPESLWKVCSPRAKLAWASRRRRMWAKPRGRRRSLSSWSSRQSRRAALSPRSQLMRTSRCSASGMTAECLDVESGARRRACACVIWLLKEERQAASDALTYYKAVVSLKYLIPYVVHSCSEVITTFTHNR